VRVLPERRAVELKDLPKAYVTLEGAECPLARSGLPHAIIETSAKSRELTSPRHRLLFLKSGQEDRVGSTLLRIFETKDFGGLVKGE
jgi:hypothetical protein